MTRYYDNWLKITNNSFILQIIKSGYKIQLIQSDINLSPVISNPSSSKKSALCNEILSLLNSGAISKIANSDSHTVSRIFNVSKKNGKNRMIIDLSSLNNYVNKVSFKMEDKNTIKTLIEPNDFLVSIDLKDDFHTISLHNDSKKLVVFEFENQRYCYNCLPFGLSSSPRIFSKILKPVISYLRSKGIKITFYLDDILLCNSSKEKLISDLNITLSLLTNLGFVINNDKSQLIPSQSLLHLGYLWNTTDMSISLPPEKLGNIKMLSRKCLKSPSSLRTLATLLGLLVNSSNGFSFAPLHYRCFQLCFVKGLSYCSDWDEIWPLSESASKDLIWWSDCALSDIQPVYFNAISPDITIFTDACLSGWGSSLSTGDITSGQWSSIESLEHINFLELKAIHLTILEFLPILSNKCIKIRSDNSTAVYYINKIGGTRSKKLCFLALEIWKLFQENNIKCHASHISGIDNSAADFFSRYSHCHEYELSSKAFAKLCEILPFELEIDVFASKQNAKLPNYVSLIDDDDASYSNAFSFKWNSSIYMFPPIPLIPKVMMKFLRDNVEFGILVTPAWHSLSIIPLLEKSLVCSPIFIHSNHLLGYLPTRHPFHLMAWPISSNFADFKVFLKMSQKLSLKALTEQHLNLIRGSGNILLNGLIVKNLDPIFLPT